MDVHEAIVGRRQIKQFKSDAIARDTLTSWLEAASYAPNHRMHQPWKILFIGPETRAKLNHKANFGDAPVVLAFLSAPTDNPVDRDENMIAVSCFIQNFTLLAQANGAGTRWTSVGSTANARTLLGVEADGGDIVEVLGVGYPADVPAVKRRAPIEEKIAEMP